MRNYLHKAQSYILIFFELQLLLSICLLPIFICWGLPISFANFCGNFIFAPFLNIFIFISTLLIFTELLYIPNQWIATALNSITKLWSYLLSFGSQKFLIGFSRATLLPSCMIIAIIGFIYFFTKWKRPTRLITLMILYFCPIAYQHTFATNNMHATLQSGKQKIELIIKNKKIIIYDTGVLGARKSYESWIDFTLLPFIIKHAGATYIDMLITHKTNPRYVQALNYLKKTIPIKQHISIHH